METAIFLVGFTTVIICTLSTIYTAGGYQLQGNTARIHGRSGEIVSYCPFDLRVMINTEATIEEIAAKPKWMRGNSWTHRTWITGWRWQVTIVKGT